MTEYSSIEEITSKLCTSQTGRARKLTMFTTPSVSHVTCQRSHVTCNVSCVTCNKSHVMCQKRKEKINGSSQWRVCYQCDIPHLVSPPCPLNPHSLGTSIFAFLAALTSLCIGLAASCRPAGRIL